LSGLARGTWYFILIQLVFLTGGYLIHAGLGRILGPSLYGTFGVVITLVTILNLILTSGIPRAVSRYIAIDHRTSRAIKKTAEKIVLIFSLMAFTTFFLSAKVLASILNDMELVPYIRVSAFILPVYAFFALYSSFLNGLREYGKEATAKLFNQLAKIFGVFIFVLLGFSITGALFGYILSPFVGLLVARHYFKPPREERNFKSELLVRFALPVIIYSVIFSVILSLDLFFVKRLLGGEKVGYYTAAYNLGRTPYFVMSALGFSLFPAVAKSSVTNSGLLSKYVRGSIRYLLLIIMPGVALISATSGNLVTLFFSARYLEASAPLTILVVGMGFFTFFYILTTVITATGRVKASVIITAIVFPVALAANSILIPRYELVGASIANVIAGFFGFFLSFAYLKHLNVEMFDLHSFIRISLATVFVYSISLKIAIRPIFLPIEFVFLIIIYIFILYIIKELKQEDFEVVRKAISIRKK
jgi:O-antigen/teichoic acid export membrane protein